MLFHTAGALAGALFAGLSMAQQPSIPDSTPVEPRELITRSSESCLFDMAKSWEDATLFHGVSSPAVDGQAAVYLDLRLPKAALSGSVSIEPTADFLLDGTIKVNLGGVKLYVELDLSASAGVAQSVELMTSDELKLQIPGLLDVDIGAAFAIDLMVSASAALDIKTGVYVEFSESAFIEISLLGQDIVDSDLTGVIADVLPVCVGDDVDLSVEVELDLGLRLRSGLGIAAGVDLLGLDIGAGAEVAIWISLFDYTAVLVATDSCPISISEEFKFSAGVLVDLNVDVSNLLDLNLAPSVIVTLATDVAGTVCLPGCGGHGSGPSGIPGGDNGATPTGVPGGDNGAKPTGPSVSVGVSGLPTTVSVPDNSGYTTSTTSIHTTYTITSCAASITNCPASYTQKVVTSSVIYTTTICPVTATEIHSSTSIGNGTLPSATLSVPAVSTTAAVTMPSATGTVLTLTPCSMPSTTTLTPAPGCTTPAVDTVTIVDTTTICPVTATEGSATSTPASAEATGPSMSAPARTTGPSSASGAPYPTGPQQTGAGHHHPSGAMSSPSGGYSWRTSMTPTAVPTSIGVPGASGTAVGTSSGVGPARPSSSVYVAGAPGKISGGLTAAMAVVPVLAVLL